MTATRDAALIEAAATAKAWPFEEARKLFAPIGHTFLRPLEYANIPD